MVVHEVFSSCYTNGSVWCGGVLWLVARKKSKIMCDGVCAMWLERKSKWTLVRLEDFSLAKKIKWIVVREAERVNKHVASNEFEKKLMSLILRSSSWVTRNLRISWWIAWIWMHICSWSFVEREIKSVCFPFEFLLFFQRHNNKWQNRK